MSRSILIKDLIIVKELVTFSYYNTMINVLNYRHVGLQRYLQLIFIWRFACLLQILARSWSFIGWLLPWFTWFLRAFTLRHPRSTSRLVFRVLWIPWVSILRLSLWISLWLSGIDRLSLLWTIIRLASLLIIRLFTKQISSFLYFLLLFIWTFPFFLLVSKKVL